MKRGFNSGRTGNRKSSGGGGGGGSGEANVQSNWTQSTTTDDSYILNKPTIQYTSAIPNSTSSQTGLATSTQITKLDGIEASADVTDSTNVASAGALMKSGGALTGAVTTNSTFDGRDVATDGSKLDGIASSANNYSHPNHSGDVVSSADGAMTIQVDAVDIAMLSATGTAGATTFLRGDNTWETPTDTDTTYSVQDGELSQINFTTADNTKLDGIATSANNYSHPTGDGNLHVPATSTTNNAKVLTAGATAGALTWETPSSGGGGGGWGLISTSNITSAITSLTLSGNYSAYSQLKIVMTNMVISGATTRLKMSDDSGSTFCTWDQSSTSNYNDSGFDGSSVGYDQAYTYVLPSVFGKSSSIGGDPYMKSMLEMDIYLDGNDIFYSGRADGNDSGGDHCFCMFSGRGGDITSVNYINFSYLSWSGGQVRLYGLTT